MKRVIICILTVTLLIGVLAVPSYAAEFDNDTGIDILDYSTGNDSGDNKFSFSDSRIINYSFPTTLNVSYVDIIFRFTGGTPSLSIGYGSTFTSLTVVKIGPSLYRAYGVPPLNFRTSMDLQFSSGQSSTVIIEAFRVYERATVTTDVRFEAIGYAPADVPFSISVDYGDSRPTYVMDYFNFEDGTENFYFDAFTPDWRLYDVVQMSFIMNVGKINSINVNFKGSPVPFTTSYVSGDGGDSYILLDVVIDLRGLDRTSDAIPHVTVTGSAAYNSVYSIGLNDCQGYIFTEVNQLRYFFMKLFSNLSSHFSSLSTLIDGFKTDVLYCITYWSDILDTSIDDQTTAVNNKLTQLLGNLSSWIQNQTSTIVDALHEIRDAIIGEKNTDTTVSDAIENQEQVNQEVNSQLQSAVGSWSDNVGEVTQGFNLALTNATPALIWISGMAQNVFSGMGWFGNIFFFLGFLHVFFLLMSKSGLGRAIDRADKRGDD